jgi:capsular exopolysaccharide synthesis family protein
MSKNFDLLTQADKDSQLFGVPGLTSQSVAMDLSQTRLDGSHEEFLNQFQFELGELARQQVAKLAQRLFHSLQDTNRLRAVMFCGIEHGDGTSWLSAQVARLVASQGSRTVCVVDANFRTPTLHIFLGVGNRRGLWDAIRQEGAIRNFLEKCPTPNLWILPAGGESVPYMTLPSERLRERIAELRAEFDVLIFDSAPFEHSSDAVTLGKLLDGVVIVVGAHSTRRVAAQKAKEQLDAAELRLLGAVLNKRTFPIPERLYRRL